MGNNNNVMRIAAALGGIYFFVSFCVYPVNIITIQYNLIL